MTELRELENGAVAAAAKPAAPAPRGLVRFLPSLTDVAFLSPLAILYLHGTGAKRMLGDGDTGWHLRTGEWILANGRVPSGDIFSWTKPGQPWFAWEWLWDVLFGWLHLHWGMAAVIFASTMVISLTIALLYRLTLRRSGNPVLAIAVTMLACFGSSMHWLARPHLFTLLFVMVFYALLERARDGRMRALLWLPLLAVLWTNLHGGFVAGVVIVGLYATGEALSWVIATGPEARAMARGRCLRYLACAAGCLAASFVNPYGYHLHTHIFQYMTDPFQMSSVQEFLPPNFNEAVGRYMEVLLLVGLVTVVWNVYQRRFTYACLLLAWMHMALLSVRHIPIVVMLAAPLVGQLLAELLAKLSLAPVAGWTRSAARTLTGIGFETRVFEDIARIPVFSAGASLLLLLLLRTGAAPVFQAEYDATLYPSRAAEAVRGEGRVFTTDVWGGYLIYRLYPDFKAFVDGRSDFYGAAFDQRYIDVLNGRYDWQQTLDKEGVQAVLLPVKAAVVGALKGSSRWRPVYDDGVSILFRRSTSQPVSAPMAKELTQVSAAQNGGLIAAARSLTTNPVIFGSQSYARRN